MKRKKIIIASVSVLLIAVLALSYATLPGFRSIADEFIANNIIGKEAPPPVKYSLLKSDLYLIADGTGSTHVSYAIPRMTTDFINSAILKIHNNNGGKLFLSYVDGDSKNNQCLYFNVPAFANRPAKPDWNEGQNSFSYQDSLAAWQKRLPSYIADSASKERKFNDDKIIFLKQCKAMLDNIVYDNALSSRSWSDVIGALNSAFKTFQAIPDSAVQTIIAFSDLQQEAPNLNPAPILNSIPSDVKIIAINPQPGSSKRVTDQVTEVPSPDLVLEKVFTNLKIVKK